LKYCDLKIRIGFAGNMASDSETMDVSDSGEKIVVEAKMGPADSSSSGVAMPMSSPPTVAIVVP
jgi:hypothetical protein